MLAKKLPPLLYTMKTCWACVALDKLYLGWRKAYVLRAQLATGVGATLDEAVAIWWCDKRREVHAGTCSACADAKPSAAL